VTGIVALIWALYLDYFSTQVGKHLAGPGARQNAAHIQDFVSSERASHGTTRRREYPFERAQESGREHLPCLRKY
jgi:hypothetical protein